MIEFARKIIKSKIFVSDAERIVPSFYLNGVQKFITPKVEKNKKKYLESIISIIKKNKIKKIIPLSDHDLAILAENKFKFKKLSCDVIISEPKFVKMCINKKKMYFFCKKNKINTPCSYFSKRKKMFNLPIFKKKIYGSGSSEMYEIKNKNELNKFNFKKYFLQNKIVGTEYGIDIFNDPKNNVSRICIKKKFLMRAGETDRSVVIIDKQIQKFAEKLIKIFNHFGNIDCDIIKDKNGKLFLIDINPRFGGGYPATHLSGMNFLKYLLTDGKFNLPKKYKLITVSKGISIHANK